MKYSDEQEFKNLKYQLEDIEKEISNLKENHKKYLEIEFPEKLIKEYINLLENEYSLFNELTKIVSEYYSKAYIKNPEYNKLKEDSIAFFKEMPFTNYLFNNFTKTDEYLCLKENEGSLQDLKNEGIKLEKQFLEIRKKRYDLISKLSDILSFYNAGSIYPVIYSRYIIWDNLEKTIYDNFLRDSLFFNGYYKDYEKFFKLELNNLNEAINLSKKISFNEFNKIFNENKNNLIKEITNNYLIDLQKKRSYFKNKYLHNVRLDNQKTEFGYIYILSNKAFPDYIKIGSTMKNPEIRASELSGTGLPFPYEVRYKIETKNCEMLEKKVHKLLEGKRVDLEREFFNCTVEQAKKVIINIVAKESNLISDDK